MEEEDLELDELQRLDFTPLCGASGGKPMCFLLELDDLRILLDCGWNEEFNVQDLEPLRKIAHTIDVCLITFPDMHHMGALPYVISEFGLTCPVVLSRACGDLGILNLYELYINYETTRGMSLFDLNDIDTIRDFYVSLSFGQRVNIYDVVDNSEKKGNIQLIIEKAGRVIGGCCYKLIRKDEVILYAPNFNHKSEHHLSPIDLLKEPKPTVLITDTHDYVERAKSELNSKEKVNLFVNEILKRLRNNANVIIPVSLSRLCEVLLILDKEWDVRNLTYSIGYISPIAKSYLRFVQSNLEYLNTDLNEHFIKTKQNMLNFKHITFNKDFTDYNNNNKEPRVMLVSLELCEHNKLFHTVLNNKYNLMLLLNKPFHDSLIRKIIGYSNKLIIPKINLRLYKWMYFTPIDIVKWKIKQKQLVLKHNRYNLIKKQEDVLINDHKDKISTDLMKILYSKTKSIKNKMVFSHNELESLVQFTEFGEKLDKDDFRVTKLIKTDDSKVQISEDKHPELINREDKYLDYSFGNLVKDSCLSKEYRTRLPRENVATDVTLYIKSDVKYFNFNGVSDSKSVKYFIEELSSIKNIVIVNGSKEDNDLFVKDNGGRANIIRFDSNTELVDISTTLSSWAVNVDDKLFNPRTNLFFSERRSVDESTTIAEIKAVIGENEEEPVLLPFKPSRLAIEDKPEKETVWDIIGKRKREREEVAFEEEELLLSKGSKTVVDIQKVLEENDIKTRFWKGYLECDQDITIRKSENSFELTGCISEKYFDTYQQLKKPFVEV